MCSQDPLLTTIYMKPIFKVADLSDVLQEHNYSQNFFLDVPKYDILHNTSFEFLLYEHTSHMTKDVLIDPDILIFDRESTHAQSPFL